jgi:hypothetical protein
VKAPVFEAIVDHNDPAHHDNLERLHQDLVTWARRVRAARLEREETALRPGVIRLRFYPVGPALTPVVARDQLVLSRS